MKWLKNLKEVMGFDRTKSETSETCAETLTYEQKVAQAKARLGTRYLLHPDNKVSRMPGSRHKSSVLEGQPPA